MLADVGRGGGTQEANSDERDINPISNLSRDGTVAVLADGLAETVPATE